MAAVTPRFMWQNYCHLSNTVITVSSEDLSFPRRWMLDPMKSLTWRSKVGWNVVAGFNDKIDFNLAGVKVATLTAGNYATGAAMATQVQTALAAAYGTGTWTVTYSTSTFKFTITHSITAFTLLPVGGANAATTAITDLGWAADTASATSQTSTAAVYQSRSFIKFDLGSAMGVDVASLVGLLGLTTSATIKIQGNATDAWTAPSYNQSIAAAAQSDDTATHWTSSTQTYRWWRMVIDDPFRSVGYVKCGIPYLGTYLQLRGPKYAAVTDKSERYSLVSVGDSGGFYVDAKTPGIGRTLEFEYLTDANKAALKVMQAAFDMKPMFFCIDPANFPNVVDYCAVLVGDFMHQKSSSSTVHAWSVTIETHQQLQ